MEGVAGIYRLILGTFPIVDPASGAGKVAMPASSEALPGAPRRSGPRAGVIDLREGPARSLRNHARGPERRNARPKLLGHDGHPAGLSNGKPPELPVPDRASGPA